MHPRRPFETPAAELLRAMTDTATTRRRVLIGVTGSVATIKVSILTQKFLDCGVDVAIVATQHAMHFFQPEELPTGVRVHTDADEWSQWTKRGDPVLHIELRKWADALVLAPLDANTLAKLAGGFSDNLLTSVLRAWDPSRPVIACPAMNTFMWTHPLTKQHIDAVEQHLPYVRFVLPISKTLMCGDVGVGAMAEPSDIVQFTMRVLD